MQSPTITRTATIITRTATLCTTTIADAAAAIPPVTTKDNTMLENISFPDIAAGKGYSSSEYTDYGKGHLASFLELH